MKTFYLIHGWGGSDSNESWFGWLKAEGKKRGFKVIGFDMPNTDEPKIKEWVGFLQEKIKEVDGETYFVGHSIGCQTIMRFFEKLPINKKVGGAVFIAGWFNLKEETYAIDGDGAREIARPWIKTPIDFEKVKSHTNNFLAIFSDDDPCVPLSDKELFEKNLGAKTIVKHAEGHFDQSEKIEEIFNILS